MCNLSKGVMEKGLAEGMAKGVEQGILSSIRNLMETMGWSTEQAMSALKIPEADRARYAALLNASSYAD